MGFNTHLDSHLDLNQLDIHLDLNQSVYQLDIHLDLIESYKLLDHFYQTPQRYYTHLSRSCQLVL